MDPLDELGSLKRRLSGQSVCSTCLKSYNNRSLPSHCIICNNELGGGYVKSELKNDHALMLTSHICSVRLNQRGLPNRIFVDLLENKVSRKKTKLN